ncbi:Sterile alpha and TIR motif-containing protein 1 [Fasciola hepatica]|uniref:ADP-ribosyl cyclase/cyclic ADP-ribose hydrolase n=1 Tax=Fasciola hepatica TaxID=6192 RepID=A0A4E0RDH5_FASHE|nr:Sterile alpha and TIR motif-containing protein 1 [Fasciola hepatica]
MSTTSGGSKIPDLDNEMSKVATGQGENDDNFWKRSKSDASIFLNNLPPQIASNSSCTGNISEHSKVYWDIPEAIEASEGTEDLSASTKDRSLGADVSGENFQYRADVQKSEKLLKSGVAQMRVHRVRFQDGHSRSGPMSSPDEDRFCRRQSTPVGSYPPLTLTPTSSSLSPFATYNGANMSRPYRSPSSSVNRNGWPPSNLGTVTDNPDRGLHRFRASGSQATNQSSNTRLRAGSIGIERLDGLDSPSPASPILRIRSTDSFTNSDQIQSRWYGSLKARSPHSYKAGASDQMTLPERLDGWKRTNGYVDNIRHDIYGVASDNINSGLPDIKPNIADEDEMVFSNSLEELQKSLFDQLEKLRSLNLASGLQPRRQAKAQDNESTRAMSDVSTKQFGSKEQQLTRHNDVEDGSRSANEEVNSSNEKKNLIDEQCEALYHCTQLLTDAHESLDAGAKFIVRDVFKRGGLIGQLLERLAEPVEDVVSTNSSVTTRSAFVSCSSSYSANTTSTGAASADDDTGGISGGADSVGALERSGGGSITTTNGSGISCRRNTHMLKSLTAKSKESASTYNTTITTNYQNSSVISLTEKQTDLDQMDGETEVQESNESTDRQVVIRSAQLLGQILSDEDLYSLLYTETDQTDLSDHQFVSEKEQLLAGSRSEHGDVPDLTLMAENDSDQTVPSNSVVSNRLSTLLQGVVRQSWKHRKDVDVYRAYMEVIEPLLKHTELICQSVVDCGVLQLLVHACRSNDVPTLRHAALSLAHISVFGGVNSQNEMMRQHAIEWLFRLAFYPDEVVQYFACLATVVLSTNPELSDAVLASGTLKLVLPFVNTHSPIEFARNQLTAAFSCTCVRKPESNGDKELRPGQAKSGHVKTKSCGTCYIGAEKSWLERLLPAMDGQRLEARALAVFHFVVEATLKSDAGRVQIFYEIKAVNKLHEMACRLNPLESELAGLALQLLGEPVPYRLNPQVPLWTPDDVQCWLTRAGFVHLVPKFVELRVDGDLLLCLDEPMLCNDLDILNGIVRLRLLRELKRLKSEADYSVLDPSDLSGWLAWANSLVPDPRTPSTDLMESTSSNATSTAVTPTSAVTSVIPSWHSNTVIPPQLNTSTDLIQYTYALLKAGINRSLLPFVTDLALFEDCHVTNAIHRARILSAIQPQSKKMFHFSSIPHSEQEVYRSPALSSAIDIPGSGQSGSGDLDCLPFERTLDCFISYRRVNGSPLASLLKVHLELRRYRVFLDIDRLPAGNFKESLIHSIQSSTNFLLVLTSKALDRCVADVDCEDWVHREIVCALQSKCNIIPITDNFVWPDADELPEDIRSLIEYNAVNWSHEYQEACIDKVEKFMIKPADNTSSFSGRRRVSNASQHQHHQPLTVTVHSTSPSINTLTNPFGDSVQGRRSPVS